MSELLCSICYASIPTFQARSSSERVCVRARVRYVCVPGVCSPGPVRQARGSVPEPKVPPMRHPLHAVPAGGAEHLADAPHSRELEVGDADASSAVRREHDAVELACSQPTPA